MCVTNNPVLAPHTLLLWVAGPLILLAAAMMYHARLYWLSVTACVLCAVSGSCPSVAIGGQDRVLAAVDFHHRAGQRLVDQLEGRQFAIAAGGHRQSPARHLLQRIFESRITDKAQKTTAWRVLTREGAVNGEALSPAVVVSPAT